MTRSFLVVVGAVLALLGAVPAASWASCAVPAEDGRARAPVAVEGVVGEDGAFAVERYLEGSGPAVLRLEGVSGAAQTSVDLDYAPGERWVMHGRLEGDVLSTNICDGSHRAGEDPDPDLAAMSGVADEGGAAGGAGAPPAEGPGTGVAPLLLGIGLLVVAGGGVLAVRGRRP